MTGHEVVSKIRKVIANLGRIKLFRAYLDVLLDSRNAKSQQTHSELHLSGVSLVHCPHYGWNRKDVTDKTMLGTLIYSYNVYEIKRRVQSTLCPLRKTGPQRLRLSLFPVIVTFPMLWLHLYFRVLMSS